MPDTEVQINVRLTADDVQWARLEAERNGTTVEKELADLVVKSVSAIRAGVLYSDESPPEEPM